MALFANGSFELGSFGPDIITDWSVGGVADVITYARIHQNLTDDGGEWSLDLRAGNGFSYAEQGDLEEEDETGLEFDYLFRELTTGSQVLRVVINGEHYFNISPVDQYVTHHYTIDFVDGESRYGITSVKFEVRDDDDEGMLEAYVDGVKLIYAPPVESDLIGKYNILLTPGQTVIGKYDIRQIVELIGKFDIKEGVELIGKYDIRIGQNVIAPYNIKEIINIDMTDKMLKVPFSYGSICPIVGETLTGISGISGVVVRVVLVSGAWDGTAKGYLYLSGVTR